MKLEAKANDGGKVSLSVVLAYNDKKTASEITAQNDTIAVYLKNLIAQKTAADFSPKNEATLQTEIRDYINDNIITGRVRILCAYILFNSFLFISFLFYSA